jgi:LPS export ABC transporter protein LptC
MSLTHLEYKLINRFKINLFTPSLLTLIILTGIALSCESRNDIIPKSDLITLPSIAVKDFETVFTDSGQVQLILTSPVMEQYDNKELPYTEFRSGIKVDFFDKKGVHAGKVTSKYAKYTKTNNLWELRDSVVVVNDKSDKLETELLFWNQATDLIYTDRFVKITNTDQIMQGFGFESDTHLQHQKLKKVSATIYFNNEE